MNDGIFNGAATLEHQDTLEVSPDISEARIGPGEETVQTFQLWNKGDSTLLVSVGAMGLPEGTFIFLHQSKMSIDAGEKKNISFTLEMDADLALKRVFEFTLQVSVSGQNAKCIIKTSTQIRKDDSIYVGQEGSDYINIFVTTVTGDRTALAMKNCTSLSRLRLVYSEFVRIPGNTLRFSHAGIELEDSKEPRDYGIKHNDVVDVMELPLDH